MLKSYMILKDHQPGALEAGFPPDEREIVSEVLREEPGLVIEKAYLAEHEAEERKGRPHIRGRVFEEGYAAAPPEPEVSAASSRVTGAKAREIHGIAELHKRGIRGKGQIIAVLDTGISRKLADELKAQGRLVAVESTVPGEDGYDETHGHGPWCIKCIADAAPDAKIVSIKVLSSKNGSGSSTSIIKGDRRAQDLGATVVSKSLGGPGAPKDAMSESTNALRRAGVLAPCAAGNDQDEKPGRMNSDEHHPGCAPLEISVAAVDSQRVLAVFSNWGNCNDVSAIGVLVEAGGVYMSGTSMATPFIAAICALLLSAKNDPTAVEKALYAGCLDSPYEVHKEGQGFALATAALQNLVGSPAPQPEPQPGPAPTTSISKWRVGQTRSAALPPHFRMTDEGYAFDVRRVKP